MLDNMVECMVKGKPNTAAKIGKVLLIVLTIATMFFSMMSGVMWLFFVGLVAAAGAYYVSLYTDVEYEYLYLDKEITVDKIYNASRRKRVAVYSLDKMEIFCPIKSYHLDNFGRREGKVTDYSIGYEDKPDLRYIMYYEGNQIVYFSPNEEMVKVMKNVAPRKVFND